MNMRTSTRLAASAIVAGLGLASTHAAQAQTASLPPGSAQPRSANERVGNELPTPPPINSDYRRAAEGQLPAGPGQAGATGRPGMAGVAGMPAGLDVAMLSEHALTMAIEGSALQFLAQRDPSGQPADESSRMLMDEARHHMTVSKALLARASGDEPRANDPSSPVRRFNNAVNGYVTALSALSDPAMMIKQDEKARVALVNHAVKGVLDADHIQQFGRMYPGSPAIEQLINHAREMKVAGMQEVSRMAGSVASAPGSPATSGMLAQRGVELLEAANQLNGTRMAGGMGGRMPGGVPSGTTTGNGGLPQGTSTDPSQFRSTRPDVIGGTYSAGSPAAGTSDGSNAPKTPPASPGTRTPNENPGSPVGSPPR